MNLKNRPLIIICGPTGIGKNRLARMLIDMFGHEIISADSMKIYKYMNIGTATPDAAVLKKYPYHLVNIISPEMEYNAAMYKAEADKIINKL